MTTINTKIIINSYNLADVYYSLLETASNPIEAARLVANQIQLNSPSETQPELLDELESLLEYTLDETIGLTGGAELDDYTQPTDELTDCLWVIA